MRRKTDLQVRRRMNCCPRPSGCDPRDQQNDGSGGEHAQMHGPEPTELAAEQRITCVSGTGPDRPEGEPLFSGYFLL